MTDHAWVEQAHCRGADTAVFFPQKEDGRLLAACAESAAKAICGPCPVREQCRDAALLAEEEHGIWGGMTYAERRAYDRARKLGRVLSA